MLQLKNFTPRSYNNLLPISEASYHYHRLNCDYAINQLLEIIYENNASETYGIRLLHKHNDVYNEEVMLETADYDDEGFYLATTATTPSYDYNMEVNSWRFEDDSIIPVEFSDKKLITSPFNLENHLKLLSLLSEKARELGVEKILGACLNYSDDVQSKIMQSDAAFLEKTSIEKRENLVRPVLRADKEFINSTKTKWYAKKSNNEDGNLSWTTACNCFCSVFPEGGHEGTKTHGYNP